MTFRSRRITTTTCHVPGCQATIASFLLMCLDHWKLVPSRMRIELKDSLAEGKAMRAHPTARYTNAARAAIDEVQGKVVTRSARSARAGQDSLEITR